MPLLATSGGALAAKSPSSALGRMNTRVAVPAAIAAAAIVGVVGTAVVAAIAHYAGVSRAFGPLKTGSYVALIVVGVVAGCVGWQLVRRRAGNPGKVLHRLVPLVVVVSFVPDLLIGATGALHATWGGVLARMCAHVVVAFAAVTSFSVLLPARAQDS